MSDSVYYGVWINWSRGKYNGSTITLTPTSAGILVAFLAIFVSMAGGSLWRILAFTIHQKRVTSASRDGLHYQQQAILRNTNTPGVGAWQLLTLILPWRKFSTKPVWTSIPLVLVALSVLSVFFTAGVLVAEVTKSPRSEVLIQSPSCGNWTFNSTQIVYPFLSKTLNDTISAATYARACYGGPTNALECERYDTKSLPYMRSENGSCPFTEGMCLAKFPTLTLDTGNISSHDHLGINTPTQDRIFYRRRTTCAPLQSKGFVRSFNYTDLKNASVGNVNGQEGDIVDLYNYGPRVLESNPGQNFTYAYNRRQATVGYGYDLSSTDYSSGGGKNLWNPDKALIQDDGDISLMFLSANNILYYDSPVKDPIFAATTPWSSMLDGGQNKTMYTSDWYVNPFACVDQHQFCNPVTQKCTKLDSYYTAVKSAQADLKLNAMQYGIVSTLSIDLYFSIIAQSIGGRGASALRAQEVVSGLFSGPIPANQWMKEVEYWFTTGLSKLQKHFVDYAAGPTNVLPGTYISKPHDSASRQLCTAVKIKVPQGSNLTSFSTLGVAIVLAVGGLIILAHLVLEYIVTNVVPTRNYKLLRWALDDKLQMQRLAFEGARKGEWRAGIGAVPTTTRREVFGMDIKGGKEHPTMDFGDVRVADDAEGGSLVSPTMSKNSVNKEEFGEVEERRHEGSMGAGARWIPPIRIFEGEQEVWPLVNASNARGDSFSVR